MTYPKQLTDRVFLLGNHYASIYLVKRDQFSVLVEAGLSVMAPQVVDQLEQLEINPASLKYLVLTHTHADHVMGAPLIKKSFPQIKITGGSESQERITEAAEVLFQRYFMDEATIFSPENTRHCMELLIRRVLESKVFINHGGDITAPGFSVFRDGRKNG